MDHLFILIEKCLHLVGPRDIDLRVDLRFFVLKRSVEEEDFSVLHNFWHSRMCPFLVDDHAFDDLGILHFPANFFLYIHMPDIHGTVRIRNHRHRPHDNTAEQTFVRLGTLAADCGFRNVCQHFSIGRFDAHCNGGKDFQCFYRSLLVSFGNNGRVNMLVEQTFRVL